MNEASEIMLSRLEASSLRIGRNIAIMCGCMLLFKITYAIAARLGCYQ